MPPLFFRQAGGLLSLEAAVDEDIPHLIDRGIINPLELFVIETGKSDSIYNINKNLDAGFDKIIAILLTKEEKEKIINKVNETKLQKENRIEIMFPAEMYNS